MKLKCLLAMLLLTFLRAATLRLLKIDSSPHEEPGKH